MRHEIKMGHRNNDVLVGHQEPGGHGVQERHEGQIQKLRIINIQRAVEIMSTMKSSIVWVSF